MSVQRVTGVSGQWRKIWEIYQLTEGFETAYTNLSCDCFPEGKRIYIFWRTWLLRSVSLPLSKINSRDAGGWTSKFYEVFHKFHWMWLLTLPQYIQYSLGVSSVDSSYVEAIYCNIPEIYITWVWYYIRHSYALAITQLRFMLSSRLATPALRCCVFVLNLQYSFSAHIFLYYI